MRNREQITLNMNRINNVDLRLAIQKSKQRFPKGQGMSLEPIVAAAEAVSSIKDGKGSIKSLCYNSKRTINKKLLYALVCQCCRHFHALRSTVHGCSMLDDTKELFWMILLYEFIYGKFSYDLNNKDVQVFWKNRMSLKNEFAIALKRFPPYHTAENQVKYMRVNRLVDNDELPENFVHVKTEDSLMKTVNGFMWDPLITDLLVLHSNCNVSLLPGFKNGSLVSQDKASCIPAFILAPPPGAHVIDCCAAPGNKTTQLASYVGSNGKVFAIEKDTERFQTLQKMVKRAGASGIVECHNRDFLALDPTLNKYSKVEYALVDPSCSGSGMPLSLERYVEGGKKDRQEKDRLDNLANFQAMIIKQAMRFPKIKAVVYSTCSINERENESVVHEILGSMPGWVLAKNPLPSWKRRGLVKYSFHEDLIRSDPLEDKMIGFFVALFIKRSNSIGS
jgi:putative methyltransferase